MPFNFIWRFLSYIIMGPALSCLVVEYSLVCGRLWIQFPTGLYQRLKMVLDAYLQRLDQGNMVGLPVVNCKM